MTITLTGGVVDTRHGLFAEQALTQSTATTAQAIALTTDITTLSGGTATGFLVDVYTLATATAVEGQRKRVLMLATGEAKVILGGGTATGAWVFTDADDMGFYEHLHGKWRVVSTSATNATST